MKLRIAVVLSTLVAFATVSLGTPAPAAADDAAIGEARTHYQQGAAAYQAGDYVTAIKQWKRADQLAPAPGLAYNIGLAYEKLGRFRAAAKYYTLYLQAEPNAPNKSEVEDRLAACNAAEPPTPVPPAPAQVGAQVAPAAPAAPAAPVASPAPAAESAPGLTPVPPANASTEPPPAPAGPAEPAPAAPPPAGEDESPAYSHWWFWAILGGSAIVVIAAAAHDSNHSAVGAARTVGVPLFSF